MTIFNINLCLPNIYVHIYIVYLYLSYQQKYGVPCWGYRKIQKEIKNAVLLEFSENI